MLKNYSSVFPSSPVMLFFLFGFFFSHCIADPFEFEYKNTQKVILKCKLFEEDTWV